jgi:hypothetical protein
MEKITQAIGTIQRFGYLLVRNEDGHNVLEGHIILGGAPDKDGEADKPHYLVTRAWREHDLVMVNASLIEEGKQCSSDECHSSSRRKGREQ